MHGLVGLLAMGLVLELSGPDSGISYLSGNRVQL